MGIVYESDEWFLGILVSKEERQVVHASAELVVQWVSVVSVGWADK